MKLIGNHITNQIVNKVSYRLYHKEMQLWGSQGIIGRVITINRLLANRHNEINRK